ncbi:MAG: hypothetical protein ACR2P7_01860 [bacterium]
MLLCALAWPRADAADGLPTNVCHRLCGAAATEIWDGFQRGHGLDLTALPQVFAGVCHVLGDSIDPDRQHHVGFLLDRKDADRADAPELRLRFSFFTPAQPYDRFDAAQAGAHFGAPALPLSAHASYAYAEADSVRFLARYWLRRDRVRDRVLMVSYFGARITILCAADQNRAE